MILCLQLGIDLDDLTNPYQAAATSAFSFCIGAGLPLLAGAFIVEAKWRILSVVRQRHLLAPTGDLVPPAVTIILSQGIDQCKTLLSALRGTS